MKKLLSLALAACLLLALLPVGASAYTAVLSPQSLTVDGKAVNCEKYNIDGSNYFKLRDLAMLLNGTGSQFGVGYDAAENAVLITPGQPYEPVGGELVVGEDKSASAVPSAQRVTVVGASAAGMSVYNIGGNNFFKLRDLGNVLGFGVDYDAATNTAVVVSGAPVQKAVAADHDLTAAEIYEKCAPAVFYIETCDITGEPYVSGSGFFIDPAGIAVTNHHVIEDALSATATLTDGRTLPISGVLYFDPVIDFAVIRVAGYGFPTLPVGDSSAVFGGEKVYALGSPQGLQNSISDGIIANPRRTDMYDYIQTTAPISPGSSGGALINPRGEVVGITVGSIEDGQNLNFAVPMNTVLDGQDPISYLNGDLVLSMESFLALDEYYRFQSLAGPYEEYYDESESNDLPDEAPELFSGITLAGTIDGDDVDCFLLRCNCPGCATVLLQSDAGDDYLIDLWLLADPVDGMLQEPVEADLCYDAESGAHYQLLRYAVKTPGLYVLYIFSDSLYESEELHTPYDLYYYFDPTDTTTLSSTGAGYDDSDDPTPTPADSAKQAAAFDAIWAWVAANANDADAAGSKGYSWTFSYDDGTSYDLALVDMEAEGSKALALISSYTYSDGDTDMGWAFLEREGQTFYFSYDYYSAASGSDSPDFTGDVDISAPSFSGSRPVRFDAVEGPLAGTDDAQAMPFFAAFTFSDMLLLLEDLIQTRVTPAGAYSVADFGFNLSRLSTDGLF